MDAALHAVTQTSFAREARALARPEARHGMLFWVALVWGASFLYALLRYVVYGPYTAVHIPLFILNKSIAFTSLALFALALFEGRRKQRQRARAFARVAIRLVLVHVAISVVLFTAGAYAKLQSASGGLHLHAQGALLMGIGGLGALLWLRLRGAHAWAGRMRLAFVALGVAHVAWLGFAGWFTPGSWLGAMPPITLLSALVGGAGLWVGLRPRRSL